MLVQKFVPSFKFLRLKIKSSILWAMPALMTQLIKHLSPASYCLYLLYVVQDGYGNHFQQTKFLLQFCLG